MYKYSIDYGIPYSAMGGGLPTAITPAQTLCSYYFNGTDHLISHGGVLNSTLSGSNPTWSYRGVVRFLANGINQTIFGKRLSADRQILVQKRTTDYINVYISNDGTNEWVATTTNTFTDTTGYYDIVVTYDGNQTGTDILKIYVNGVEEAYTTSGTITQAINASTAYVYIGQLQGGTSYLDGYINQYGITSDVLSSGETTSLYNSGSPRLLRDIVDNIELDCIFDNDTFSTNWSVIDDSGNSYTGTSSNMTAVDRDCNENPY